jgi:DNA mismatch repair protein MutS
VVMVMMISFPRPCWLTHTTCVHTLSAARHSQPRSTTPTTTPPPKKNNNQQHRSAGIAVLLAQVGSFVPCDAMEWTPVDRLLCRVGASDAQLRGWF